MNLTLYFKSRYITIKAFSFEERNRI